jgi:hypothetical protein
LDRSKFGANLNPFEISLIRVENRIGRTVLPTPPVSAASTASPCHTQPLMIGAPSCPVPPVSRVDRVVPTPPSSTVARQRATHVRHGWAAAAPTTRRRTAPRHAQGPLPLPLSLPLCLHAASTLWAPSPPLSVKMEPPPAGRRFFSPRAPFVSPVHARAPRLCSHSPGILHASFPPPEPLVLVGLRPSVAVVRPSSVSALRASPFPKLGLTSAFPSHTGAAGPLRACR